VEGEKKATKKNKREAYKKKKINKSGTSWEISLQCVYGMWASTEGALRRTSWEMEGEVMNLSYYTAPRAIKATVTKPALDILLG